MTKGNVDRIAPKEIVLAQVRLRTEILGTPSPTQLGLKVMTFRS